MSSQCEKGMPDSKYDDINNIPNDQYSCIKCNLVPEIKKINYEEGIIEFECPKHGIKKLLIKDYFINELENLYYNSKCTFGGLKQWENLKNIFKKCFKCGNTYCFKCANVHEHKKNFLKSVNELNNICPIHFNNYNFYYCSICKKHFCKDEKCNCNHGNERKKINKAKDEDIKKIKDTKAQLIKKKETLEYSIKLLDTILTTYEKHPYNYYNTINIEKVAKNEFIFSENKDIMVMKSLKLLEEKVIDYFYTKFGVKINNYIDKELNFENKNLEDLDLKLLCGLNFKNLEKINLSKNQISDVGPIASLNAPKLKKLNLTFNKINKINPLKEALKNNIFKFIEEIKLENNNILQKDIEDIQRLIGGQFEYECKIKYKLDKNVNKIRIFGENFINENGSYCKIKIEDKKQDISEFYEYENKKIKKEVYLVIDLYLRENIKDLSGLFSECNSLYSIENIFNLDPKIQNLSELFSGCSSLIKISDNISNWDISNVSNISGLFYGCENLTQIPDISKWNTKNIEDMKSLFNGCKLLKCLPDISKWNTSKVNDIGCMFKNCLALEKLPNISEWDISSVTDISAMFYKCKSLKSIPDISNWNTSNVKNMKELFYECIKLDKRPDISKWNISDDTDKTDMFKNVTDKK